MPQSFYTSTDPKYISSGRAEVRLSGVPQVVNDQERREVAGPRAGVGAGWTPPGGQGVGQRSLPYDLCDCQIFVDNLPQLAHIIPSRTISVYRVRRTGCPPTVELR